MISEFTEEEDKRISEIQAEYEGKLLELEMYMNTLEQPGFDYKEPDMPAPTGQGEDGLAIYDEAEYAEWQEKAANAWHNSGNKEWRNAIAERSKLTYEMFKAISDYRGSLRQEQFDRLGNDPKRIISDAVEQTTQRIKHLHDVASNQQQQGNPYIAIYLRVEENGKIWIDSGEALNHVKDRLSLHFDFFKGDSKKRQELEDKVLTAVLNSTYTSSSKGILWRDVSDISITRPKDEQFPSLVFPATVRPDKFISPTDPVSRKLFADQLEVGLRDFVNVAKRGTPEINLKVSINIIDSNILINGKPGLGPYDREVHDAIVTLYLAGNSCFTAQMIYRTMTGNEKTTLGEKQHENIMSSLRKLMSSVIEIDNSEEAKARKNIKPFKLTSNLIQAKFLTDIKHKGNPLDPIQISEVPILYTYANTKNQVSRIDMKLLNSPIDKTEENIILQGYLQRRISAKALNNTIDYDTVYSHLGIAAETPGALRKREHDIRKKCSKILDYWIAQDFIRGYEQIHKGRKIHGVKIFRYHNAEIQSNKVTEDE